MIAQKYTHKPIKGIKYKYMLPEGVSLVLEGGGTRGFYTAGVFEAFMDEGIMFPYIIGVSAGAAIGASSLNRGAEEGRAGVFASNFWALSLVAVYTLSPSFFTLMRDRLRGCPSFFSVALLAPTMACSSRMR